MKKLLLIFAIIVSGLISSAQTALKYTSSTTSELRPLADSIASNAKRTYTFSKDGVHPDDDNYYYIQYINTSDDTDKMNIIFRIRMVGVNDALELLGTPQYTFYRAYGRFLDLYGFYVKYINTSAVAETIIEKNGDKKLIDGYRFRISESSNRTLWQIECSTPMN